MNEMKISETNVEKNLIWKESTSFATLQDGEMNMVCIFPEAKDQKLHGFGGAFTEAAAHIYRSMPDKAKEKVLEALFGIDGLLLNMGRIHMNSCDFSLGNYTYIEEGDTSLDTFSIEHDRKEIIPFIHDAMGTSDDDIEFMASVWSPPAFMKTNGEMNNGGSLKPEYKDVWAKYYAKFIEAYAVNGINIRYFNVQNEPAAVQEWDSCLYSAEEEAVFVRDHLYPAIDEAGLNSTVKIFVWDHNKERAYERFRDSLNVKGAKELIAGCSVHWYTGDHFENLRLIHDRFPDKEIFFTEGCVEYSRYADATDTDQAERYAHDIIGNLNNGCSAVFDWNLMLDSKGGPNHVGNFCAAPLMYDEKINAVKKQLFYYYIGQFSRYIKRGAVRIAASSYSDKAEVTSFVNPDGERVVVLLNRSDEDIPVILREDQHGVEMTISAHSIRTCRYY